MGNVAASLEGRWLLAAAILLGIAMILLGVLYLSAVFLGGRRWFSSKLGKIAAPTFYFFTLAPFYLLVFSFVMPRIFAPQPSRSGYIVSGLLFSTLMLITLPARGFSSLVTRLTTTPSNPPPAPEIKWARLCWTPVLGLVLGLALGLLIGWLLGGLLPYLPNGTADVSLPVFQRASVLFTLGVGGSIGLVFGLIDPFQRRLEWWVKYLPRERFARVGASLIVIGSVIIGIATWLVA